MSDESKIDSTYNAMFLAHSVSDNTWYYELDVANYYSNKEIKFKIIIIAETLILTDFLLRKDVNT